MGRPGTPDEFTRFVEASAGRLIRTAYLVVGDLTEAEDLSQEALAKVARRWSRVRRMESPFGYARRILFNLALQEQSRQWRRANPTGGRPEPAVNDEADAIAARDEVSTAIDLLPARQRATLILRYWDELSERETAEALGCSIGTVKSQTSKALRRLRDTLPSPGHVSPERNDNLERTS